jgi:ribosomal-protein-alanine N-acetyltransferase
MIPDWAEELELQEFGSPWGSLGEFEMQWHLDKIAFARWQALPEIGEAELLRIAVAPDQRRQGIAKRLMAESSKHLVSMGCKYFFLEVRQSNVAAQKLYESLGWLKINSRAAYYSDGEEAVVYGLFMSPPPQA